MITKHHPYPLAWLLYSLFIIIGAIGFAKDANDYRPPLLIIMGLVGLLLMQRVEVSDDAVTVSWAFGLRKRVIPLHVISDIACRSEGVYGWLGFTIYIVGGNCCYIFLGTSKLNALLLQDIRSRLKGHNKCANKRVQGTLHKVPGPLTPDVRTKRKYEHG